MASVLKIELAGVGFLELSLLTLGVSLVASRVCGMITYGQLRFWSMRLSGCI